MSAYAAFGGMLVIAGARRVGGGGKTLSSDEVSQVLRARSASAGDHAHTAAFRCDPSHTGHPQGTVISMASEGLATSCSMEIALSIQSPNRYTPAPQVRHQTRSRKGGTGNCMRGLDAREIPAPRTLESCR